MENITRDFNGATEKGIEVYYNDNLGHFEVHVNDFEVISFYDEDGTNTAAEVQEFIDEQ